MKKEDNKTNKTYSTFYYIISVCFYIIAMVNLVKGSNSTGCIFLCLGSTFLCLGSVYLYKDNEKGKDKNNK